MGANSGQSALMPARSKDAGETSVCGTDGCSHPASRATRPGTPELFCDCCYRGLLERRLAEALLEARRLPGEIEALPRHCDYEVRPEYEHLST